jgi:hypothetical protein
MICMFFYVFSGPPKWLKPMPCRDNVKVAGRAKKGSHIWDFGESQGI